VAYKIVSLAHLSAMIVRAYRSVDSSLTDFSYRRLLVPLDGSRRAECVLPPATILASFYDSDVMLAHVVSRPQMICLTPLPRETVQLLDRWANRNRLAATGYLKQLSSRLSVDAWTRLIVDDDVAGALFGLAASESADLVVLSAHGHSGVAAWPYGNTAANFIDRGTTPLLIVQDIAPDHIGRSRAEIAVDEQTGRPLMYATTGKQ
jgi:nucleotide-binding universal stress UspA family protein